MRALWTLFLALCTPSVLFAADVIPHAQDKPPNDPRDAQTAAKLMTVPEGFVVDVVASEPDIVNPVAMFIDEKGRFWITESLEYPRKSPGPGKDRVKILEDTDGDGKMDKFSIFLDGLNIPSGVAVGHGGVWIANSPDILFVPDVDRDGKPDGPAQVVVTGFGRTDTHELPNSLTWGPDGWLYGLNGVFNFSKVTYPKDSPWLKGLEARDKGQEDKSSQPDASLASRPSPPVPTEFNFTCAMWRIHPRTREFQIFCEGTSNPWGIAFNDEGDAFVSACVIDHLWHLVETGYYHRQGGPYPPHTWKIESIVKHKHQKAAYCGITWFDSDAYPEQYRKKLYMGNIHGGCINVDRIERNGSTYAGFGEPDFLTANDAWFMPVVQKTGPDGCLYIVDWYDRYHCYQDANRDPAGIDRLKGRLYRVRYKGDSRRAGGVSPLLKVFDLGKETDDKLIERLGHPNVWMRETAQRLLQERNSKEIVAKLKKALLDGDDHFASPALRHAIFALLGCDLHQQNVGWEIAQLLFEHPRKNAKDSDFLRAWAVRSLPLHYLTPSAGEAEQSAAASILGSALDDDDPAVRLQAAIAIGMHARRSIHYVDYSEALAESVAKTPNDLHFAKIVWQALKPMMEDHPQIAQKFLDSHRLLQTAIGREFQGRIIEWILSQRELKSGTAASILQSQLRHNAPGAVLQGLAKKVQTGELAGERLADMRQALEPEVSALLAKTDSPHFIDAALLAVSWGDDRALPQVRKVLLNKDAPAKSRSAAFDALVSAKHPEILLDAQLVLVDKSRSASSELKSHILAGLVAFDQPTSVEPTPAQMVLDIYPQFDPELQPRAIELLTQRPAWAIALLNAIGEKKLPQSVLNVNQARKLFDSKNDQVRELLAKHWGQVREGRSPDREKVVAEMRGFIRTHKGDALAGEAVFKRVCAQCHKLYGEGAEVGPDITLNGRNDFTQLLSNVFDPSLVIGAGYRSYTVATEDGRVINGLLVEDSPQRIVLKVQGGKQEVIPRDNIDIFKVSETSFMPEQLERQLTPTEISDLFAYITLDKPPRDPQARRLPGVYDVTPRQSTNPADFAAIFQEVAPGFTEVTSGEGGVALLKEHFGRPGVVRTHPISRDKPAEMSGKFTIPASKKTKLVVDVSHDPKGDWRLVVSVGGRLIDELVNKDTCKNGWCTFTADLTKYAGQEITIRMANQANDWSYEFAYWGSVRLVSESTQSDPATSQQVD